MTDVLRVRGSGPAFVGPTQSWLRDYSRGLYTEVVQGWLVARAEADAPAWLACADVAEAVGWSLALTKSWGPYASFRADLQAHPENAPLLSILDAWRAIHEARYDACLHAVRGARSALLAPGGSSRTLAHALRVEGVALLRLGRYAEAEAVTRAAAQLYDLAGDLLDLSHCATNLGLVLNARGDLPAARGELQRAVDALLELGAAEERLALARVNLAVVELHLGHVGTARSLLESALATFETAGLRSEQVTALNGLGHCARVLGRFDQALAHHRAALRLAGPDLDRQMALCHEFLGQVLFDRGDTARAETYYRRALDMAAHIAPDGDLMLEVCWRYGELLAERGRREEALDLVARAEALCSASGERRELGCVQRVRARLLAAEGSTGARAAFEAAAETLATTGRVFEWGLALLAHAEHEAARGDRERAETLLDRARGALAACAPTSTWLERIDRTRERLLLGGACGAPDAGPVLFGIVTRDPEMLAALEDLPALAASPWPVLVEGESGTGKELAARALHATSGRTGPFVALNCAAIPRDLFESELFGHLRGAFSGAHAEKPGLFEQAAGGTLFLDEIGEMPLELQAKLLRVLDDGLVRRLGDVRQRRVDVKVVAATNRPLEPSVVDGRFRGDLFHRLAVHSLRLKPLRERPGDIAPLARHLLEREGLADRLALSPELLADLEARPWPGNARELRNVLLRLVLQRQPPAVGAPAGTAASLRATRSTHERRVIETALAATGGNVGQAARTLRLHATTLRRKMRALGVERPS